MSLPLRKTPEGGVPTAPDRARNPEGGRERATATVSELPKQNAQEQNPVTAPSQPAVSAPEVVPEKDPQMIAIESILSDGLADVYRQMPLKKQAAFRRKGEEVALRVQKAMRSAHFAIRKVLGWVRAWLKLIPGVSKIYLEQEAKIKADKLAALDAREKPLL